MAEVLNLGKEEGAAGRANAMRNLAGFFFRAWTRRKSRGAAPCAKVKHHRNRGAGIALYRNGYLAINTVRDIVQERGQFPQRVAPARVHGRPPFCCNSAARIANSLRARELPGLDLNQNNEPPEVKSLQALAFDGEGLLDFAQIAAICCKACREFPFISARAGLAGMSPTIARDDSAA